MGSIRRQSTQVIAKNSMKSRSFCFTAIFFAGVGVEGTFVEISWAGIGVREAGGGATAVACGAAQATTINVVKKRKAYRFTAYLQRALT